MKIGCIILNSLKRKLNDYKFLGFMIVFPLFLTILFIIVFSKVGEDLPTKKINLKVGFYSEAQDEQDNNLRDFFQSASKPNQIIIETKLIDEIEQGKKELTDKVIDVLVHRKNNGDIQYVSDSNMATVSTFETLLESFVSRSAVYKTVLELGEQGSAIEGGASHLYTLETFSTRQEDEANKDETTIVLAATMIVFAILLASDYGMSQVHYIKHAVGKRVQTAPISKRSIYFGEYIAGVMMTFVQGSVITFILEALFNLGLRQNIFQVSSIILCCSLMAIAVGITVGAVVDDKTLGGNIISMFILLLCFTSGGFTSKVMDMGEITKFSPVTIINQGILDICLFGETKELWLIGLMTLGIGMVGLAIAYIGMGLKGKGSR